MIYLLILFYLFSGVDAVSAMYHDNGTSFGKAGKVKIGKLKKKKRRGSKRSVKVDNLKDFRYENREPTWGKAKSKYVNSRDGLAQGVGKVVPLKNDASSDVKPPALFDETPNLHNIFPFQVDNEVSNDFGGNKSGFGSSSDIASDNKDTMKKVQEVSRKVTASFSPEATIDMDEQAFKHIGFNPADVGSLIGNKPEAVKKVDANLGDVQNVGGGVRASVQTRGSQRAIANR